MLVPAIFLTAPVLDAMLSSTALGLEVYCVWTFFFDYSLYDKLYAYVVVASMAA